jgi:tubulin--tyrosine ligase
LDFEKYETPFKFYVGKGNNGNLIKSLMKKRFWFERTENIEEANFIWTQIKKEKLYEKQKPS